jgi:Autoinducer binding domain
LHIDDLFQLLAQLSQAQRIEAASDALGDFTRCWGLSHVAYAGLNMPSNVASRPLLAVSYSAEWQKHYAQSGYVDIDPIVRAGLGGILPIDWETIDRDDVTVRKFFGEAQECDVGAHGLSIPIRGRHGEFALFTVTSNLDIREWRAIQRELLRELMIVAWNFHAAALRTGGEAPTGGAHLSLREASCLRWKALGKKGRRDRADTLHQSAYGALPSRIGARPAEYGQYDSHRRQGSVSRLDKYVVRAGASYAEEIAPRPPPIFGRC